MAVLGAPDGDVGGSGVFVGPAAVEGGADCPGDAVVAGPDASDVFVGEGTDGLESLRVVAGGPLEGSFVEAGDEFRERAGRMLTDGVAQDGAGDAFVVRLGERLRSKEPVDDGFGVASPAVERLAAAISGVQAGHFGEGQEGVAGGGVRFAVDPVDVPTAAEGFAGQGQGGNCLAAAGLADDEGLVPPGVDRRSNEGPASAGEPPVPDVTAECQTEDGPLVGRRPGRPPNGATSVCAAAPFLAHLAVVAGRFVLVAVMQDCREEGRGEVPQLTADLTFVKARHGRAYSTLADWDEDRAPFVGETVLVADGDGQPFEAKIERVDPDGTIVLMVAAFAA